MPGRRGKWGVKEGSLEKQEGAMKLSKKMVHFGCLVLCVLAWHAGHAELCCDFS